MIKILITGAGSVMGQSIYQALNKSPNRDQYQVVFTNSDEFGAGFYFNFQEQYKVKIVNTYIVPLAVDEKYLPELEKIIKKESIDIVYSGTQHELMKIAEYNKGNCAVISKEVIAICLDKLSTYKMFHNNEIAFPITMPLLDYCKNVDRQYPVVVKPKTDSSSRNIFVVSSETEMDKIMAMDNLDHSSMIAQEYLDGEEYTCGCYVDKFNNELQTITFKRELTPDGATGYGEVIEDQVIESYLADICRMLQNNGMEYGHINVQLRMVGNKPYCFEINPRLSSTESPKATFGYNSVDAYINNIVLNKSCKKMNVEPGKFIRYYEDVIIK